MDAIQAVVLGIVEGLTEYLPVSSTGHLILAQRALGIPRTANADAFAVVIQLGAILAVLALYGGRFAQVARGVLGRDAEGRRLAVGLAAAFVPAGVVGLLFGSAIKAALFNLPAIATAWFAGGIAILLVAWWRGRSGEDGGGRPLSDLDWKLGLAIGAAQVLSMWPGTSRSLVTILAGLLAGLSMPAAVEFSFLLGAVTLTAASAKDFWDHGAGIVAEHGWSSLALGVTTATIAAAASVKWMVAWLNRHGLAVFGWYRIALAVVVAALLILGKLPATV